MKKKYAVSRCAKFLLIFAACVFVQSASASAEYLTAVAGSPFSTSGNYPYYGAYSPDNKWFATANYNDGTLTIFSVDATTGVLTQIAGSPFNFTTFPILNYPYALTYSPFIDGQYYLACVNDNDYKVCVFLVDQETGDLTAVGSYSTGGSEPYYSISYSPNGKWLAVPNYDSNTTSVFSVDQETGALSTVPGSPFAIAGLSYPGAVAFSSDSQYLATANYGGGILICSVDQTSGVLTLVQTISSTPAYVFYVAYSPDGKWLAASSYQQHATDNVYLYAVGAGGMVTFASSYNTLHTTNGLAFSPDSSHLAVSNSDGYVTTYVVSGSGLTQSSGSPFSTDGTYTYWVAYSPNDLWLAALNSASNTVATFKITYTPPSTSIPTSNLFSTRLIEKYNPRV